MIDGKKLIPCPYDPVHLMKESRLQIHIVKCRQNNLDCEKFTCPFNAQHVFPKQEEKYHLLRCPNKDSLDRKLAQDMDKNNPNKGNTSVPSYTASAPIEPEELWDDDITSGYVMAQPPPNAILAPRDLAKPAERRRFYAEMHQRKEVAPIPSIPPPTMPAQPLASHTAPKPPAIPRQPIQTSRVEMGAGIGRGRIAASIFPGTSFGTYSDVASNFSQMNLGRSHPAVPLLDDDFPALGMGRGRRRDPAPDHSN